MDSGSRSRCSLGRNDADLERNLVVHLATPAATTARAGSGCDFARGPGRAEIATRVVSAEIAATAA
jgi:hypothetical protein